MFRSTTIRQGEGNSGEIIMIPTPELDKMEEVSADEDVRHFVSCKLMWDCSTCARIMEEMGTVRQK